MRFQQMLVGSSLLLLAGVALAGRPEGETIALHRVVLQAGAPREESAAAQMGALERVLETRLKLKDAWDLRAVRIAPDRLAITYKEGPTPAQLPGLFAVGRFRICLPAGELGQLLAGLERPFPEGVRVQKARFGPAPAEVSPELSGPDRGVLETLVATKLRPRLPAGVEVAYARGSDGERGYWTAVLFPTSRCLVPEAFPSAFVRFTMDSGDGPHVQAELSVADRKRFEDLTRARVGRRLAFLLDGELLGRPTVTEAISSGRIWLPSWSSRGPAQALEELSLLSVLLQSGPLPVPVRVVETHVGVAVDEPDSD